ncbi:MAG: hypothetical protein AB1601_10070 [Planctomycetota bacterium]
MPPSFGMVMGPWNDAADGRVGLERAAGEAGLDHVTVLAVSGPLVQWRLDEHSETPLFVTEGGWHFPPTAKLYAGVGLRPVRARWLGSGDPLEGLCRQAERLGLRVVVRVDGLAAGVLPESAQLGRRNAWGQELATAGACPCNPAVRELIRATLDDLRRYGPADVELADDGPDHALPAPVGEALAWHPAARAVGAVCFCPACRQIAARAGVDPLSAARSARVLLGQLAREPSSSATLRDDPVLGAYLAARTADHDAWLRRLADADTQRRHLLVRPADAAEGRPTSLDVVLRWTAGTTGAPGGTAGPTIAGDLSDGHIVGWSVSAWRPVFGAAAELVRWAAEATQRGATWFDFEGLDTAPPDAVTWLRQAVRYARRGA